MPQKMTYPPTGVDDGRHDRQQEAMAEDWAKAWQEIRRLNKMTSPWTARTQSHSLRLEFSVYTSMDILHSILILCLKAPRKKTTQIMNDDMGNRCKIRLEHLTNVSKQRVPKSSKHSRMEENSKDGIRWWRQQRWRRRCCWRVMTSVTTATLKSNSTRM